MGGTKSYTLLEKHEGVIHFMQISIKFHVGQGTQIRFWTDVWLQNSIKNMYPNLYHNVQNCRLTVSQAYNQQEWDIGVPQVHSIWAEQERDAIGRNQKYKAASTSAECNKMDMD